MVEDFNSKLSSLFLGEEYWRVPGTTHLKFSESSMCNQQTGEYSFSIQNFPVLHVVIESTKLFSDQKLNYNIQIAATPATKKTQFYVL